MLGGWTFLYRSRPDQSSFSSTKRSAGVHTTTKAAYEKLAKCLLEVPLESNFSPDDLLLKSPSSIVSLDYCTFKTGPTELSLRGSSFVSSLETFISRDSGRHNAVSHNLITSIKVLRKSNPEKKKEERKTGKSGGIERFAAKIVLVTTTGGVTKPFEAFLNQLSKFDGMVKIIIVGSSKVCISLRYKELEFCLPPGEFSSHNFSLPEVTRMLQVGVDNVFPNITKFVGFVRFDLTFVDRIPSLLCSAISVPPMFHLHW